MCVLRFLFCFFCSGGVLARSPAGRVCASLGSSEDDAVSASKKAFDDVLAKGSTEVRIAATKRQHETAQEGYGRCREYYKGLCPSHPGSGAKLETLTLYFKRYPKSTEESTLGVLPRRARWACFGCVVSRPGCASGNWQRVSEGRADKASARRASPVSKRGGLSSDWKDQSSG